MNIALEPELVAHHDAGLYTAEQWAQYWWKERAEALQAIAAYERHIATLRTYVDRCSALIDESEKAQPSELK